MGRIPGILSIIFLKYPAIIDLEVPTWHYSNNMIHENIALASYFRNIIQLVVGSSN